MIRGFRENVVREQSLASATRSRSVGELVHHCSETRPIQPLASLAIGTGPVHRTTTDFEGSQLFVSRKDFERECGSRAYELDIRQLGAHLVLSRLQFLGHERLQVSEFKLSPGYTCQPS